MNITKINKYNVREGVFGLIWNIGYDIFYYKLLLFTTDFKWFLCVDKLLLYVMVGLEAGGEVKGGWWWKQYLWSFTYNLSLMNIQS